MDGSIWHPPPPNLILKETHLVPFLVTISSIKFGFPCIEESNSDYLTHQDFCYASKIMWDSMRAIRLSQCQDYTELFDVLLTATVNLEMKILSYKVPIIFID